MSYRKYCGFIAIIIALSLPGCANGSEESRAEAGWQDQITGMKAAGYSWDRVGRVWKNDDAPDGVRVLGQWADLQLRQAQLNERTAEDPSPGRRPGPYLFHKTTRDDPLFRAAREGNMEQIDRLIIQGSRIDSVDREGNTLLMHACSYGHLNLIEPLVMMGIDIDARNSYGRTALIQAVAAGDFFMIDRLLEHRAKINLSDNMGGTPLMHAIMKNRLDLARYLIAMGAEVAAGALAGSGAKDNRRVVVKDNEGASLVDWAYRSTNEKLIEYIESSSRGLPASAAEWSGPQADQVEAIGFFEVVGVTGLTGK